MVRRAGRRWWWGLAVIAWVGVASLALGPDPGFRITQAESFAVRAVDVSGHRHPIATFDGRSWLIDPPRLLVGPPAPDPPAIVGLETSDGVPVSTIRVFAASGERWVWARQAVEALATRTAGLGDRRLTEISTYVPAGGAGSPVYVDLTVRTPEPRWQGTVVGAWVLPQDDAEPVVLGARQVDFGSYDEYLRIPRRHPLGIAVAGRGGVQTWVMYNRSPVGDSFELAAVGRRGLRELPPIPRGGS
jgi:hypothetical protein